MKTIKTYAMSLLAVAAFTCNATAALILLAPPSPYKLTPENTANIIANASPFLDPNGLCEVQSLLRLDNLALPSLGSPFMVAYTQTGGNPNNGATVNWDLTGTGFHLLGVYVFGGSNGANLYQASDPITGGGHILSPLTGKSGGFATISHVLFLGCANGEHVPDGGQTAALFSLALGSAHLIRRKLCA